MRCACVVQKYFPVRLNNSKPEALQVSPVNLGAMDPVSHNWTRKELQHTDHLSASVSSAFGLRVQRRSFPREKAQSSQTTGCSWTHLGRHRDDGWVMGGSGRKHQVVRIIEIKARGRELAHQGLRHAMMEKGRQDYY